MKDEVIQLITPAIMADSLEDIRKRYGPAVMPIYKSQPPFERQEFGYKGLLLWNSETDQVLCNACGDWMIKIETNHLKHKHQMNAFEYKQKFGLFKYVALEGVRLNEQRSVKRKEYIAKNPEVWEKTRGNAKKFNTEDLRERVMLRSIFQFRNRYGSCDAQLKFRYQLLRDKLGRPVQTRDDVALASALKRRYGSFDNAKRAMGFFNDLWLGSVQDKEEVKKDNGKREIKRFKCTDYLCGLVFFKLTSENIAACKSCGSVADPAPLNSTNANL